jgi:Tfp pilus assembly protein PilV
MKPITKIPCTLHGTSLKRAFEQRGLILLEVVLALVLFAGAAVILSSALTSSIESAERQKRDLHATNLALSLLGELQIGARPASLSSFPFEPPFEKWTGEIIAGVMESETGEGSGLSQVEVVVRHTEFATVCRLGQVLKLPQVAEFAGYSE